MKQIAEYRLNDNETVLIEVEPESPEISALIGNDGPFPVSATLNQALNVIGPVSEALFEKIRSLGSKAGPKSATVEFGITLGGGVRAFIVAANAEANFKVTLSWEVND